jgi:pyruvate formate lyase activating enzyme
LIRVDRRGICQVRFNRDGKLYVPWGYVAALQVDPIEKKPFFHVLPGADALTFGMLGCDFHCDYCQNHLTSQAMRDPASDMAVSLVHRISPEQIVEYARRSGAEIVASSYNEPLITSEWAVSIFRLTQQAGMKNVFISNGNATPEVLDYLHPYLAAYKIDLKTMQDRQYRKLGGVLEHVLDSIRRAHELELWVEIVTLVVPGFNDSTDELMDTARFIASVSPQIPWHVSAFHPDYKMLELPRTSVRTLIRAAEIGQEAGLNHVYAGNIPGRVGEYESTYCPQCRTPLVERYSYVIRGYHLTAQGACPKCGTEIAGVWSDEPDAVRIGGKGMPRLINR